MYPLNKNIWFRGGVKVAFFKSSFRVVASHLDDNLTVLSKTDKKKADLPQDQEKLVWLWQQFGGPCVCACVLDLRGLPGWSNSAPYWLL